MCLYHARRDVQGFFHACVLSLLCYDLGMKEKTVPVQIRLPATVRRALAVEAAKRGMSQSQVVLEALERAKVGR